MWPCYYARCMTAGKHSFELAMLALSAQAMLDPGDHHHHVLKKLPLDMHVIKVDLRSTSYLYGC